MVRKRPLNLERSLERFLQTALLAMLLCGFLAVAIPGLLDAPALVLGAVALLLRLMQLSGLWSFTLSPRWANLLAGCYLLLVPADFLFYSSRDLVRTTVHVIVFASAVKMLSARTRRDSVLLGLVSFLLMLAAALGSAGVAFLLLLLFYWPAALAALACSEIGAAMRGRTSVGSAGIGGRLGGFTGVAGVAVLLMTVALFLVLPRTARLALERLTPAMQRVSGFAPEFTLGQPGEIHLSRAPMLHVRFYTGQPSGALHWRATALAEFDGRRWYNTPHYGDILHPGGGGYVQLVSDDQRRRDGPRASYEVVLHGGSDYLFFAGLPENVNVPADTLLRTPPGGIKLPFGGAGGLRYYAYSYFGAGDSLDEAPPLPLSPDERDFHLRLPPLDPRILRLARSITAHDTSDLARARSLERYLQTHGTYSLEPVESDAADPLAAFLFDSHKGHCEYFASAMAVLLRELWIPSRVATGYVGGTANPYTGWLVVRASDAHAWVEAWIPGQGWTSFDPTPPGQSWNPAASLLSRLGLYLDAAETFWQEWIVGYDQDRQLTLAFSVNQSRRLSAPWLEQAWRCVTAWWKGLMTRPIAVRVPVLIAAALLLLSTLALLFRRRLASRFGARSASDPGNPAQATHEAARLYREMLGALHSRGIEKASFQTPAEFAACVTHPAAAPLVADFTSAYHVLRYGRDVTQTPHLAALLREIQALPR